MSTSTAPTNSPSPMDTASSGSAAVGSPMSISTGSSDGTEVSVESIIPAGDRIMVVKCSVDALHWNPVFRDNLNNFVHIVHVITTHTYSFAKFIFMREIADNVDFHISHYITYQFFSEVWLSLTEYDRRRIRSAVTIRNRELIDNYLQDYLEASGFERIPFQNGQQISIYEGRKMEAAYLNNVSQHFGNHYRRLVNHILDIKQRSNNIKRQNIRLTDREKRTLIYNNVTNPARRFKLMMTNRTATHDAIREAFPDRTELYIRAYDALERIFRAYPQGYTFQENNIFYDVKARTVHHFRAFHQMAMLFVEHNLRVFNCFPLRRTWSPCYTTIDTKILYRNIMEERGPEVESNWTYWSMAIDMDVRVLRSQEHGLLNFGYMIQTDAVGVSILKRRHSETTRTFAPSLVERQQEGEVRYITELTAAELQEFPDGWVTVDPGRRDLLFFLHENSTVDNRNTLRFTKMELDKLTKYRIYRQMLERIKTQDIRNAEARLINARSVNVEEFGVFLQNRHDVTVILSQFYQSTLSLTGEPNDFLIRKLRFNRYRRQQRANIALFNKIRENFGENTVLVMGNWSAPNVRYHEPIKGVGMRRLRRKMGFTVYLIDEYLTSTLCPQCETGIMTPFGTRPNPRPYRRPENPRVNRHGLLCCDNDTCKPTLRTGQPARFNSLWNRNLAACRNMHQILRGVRAGSGIPVRFQRPVRTRQHEPPFERNVRARRGRPRSRRGHPGLARGQPLGRGEDIVERRPRRGRPRGPRGRGRNVRP